MVMVVDGNGSVCLADMLWMHVMVFSCMIPCSVPQQHMCLPPFGKQVCTWTLNCYSCWACALLTRTLTSTLTITSPASCAWKTCSVSGSLELGGWGLCVYFTAQPLQFIVSHSQKAGQYKTCGSSDRALRLCSVTPNTFMTLTCSFCIQCLSFMTSISQH